MRLPAVGTRIRLAAPTTGGSACSAEGLGILFPLSPAVVDRHKYFGLSLHSVVGISNFSPGTSLSRQFSYC